MKIRRLKQFDNDYFITDDSGTFINGPRFKTHDEAKIYLKMIKGRIKLKNYRKNR